MNMQRVSFFLAAFLALTLFVGGFSPLAQGAANLERRVAADSPTPTGSPQATRTAEPTRSPEQDDKEKEKEKEKERERDRERERKVTLTGSITAKGSSDFTIRTRVGRTVNLIVDIKTEFKREGSGKNKPTFADLTVGMTVTAYALRANTPQASPTPSQTPSAPSRNQAINTVRSLQAVVSTTTAEAQWTAVRVLLPRAKPKFSHIIGEITALSTTSISVKDKDGKSVTGVLSAQTEKNPKGATFAVGDRVLALARWDDSQGNDGAWVVFLLVKLGQGPVATTTPTPATATPQVSPTAAASPTATATVSPTAIITTPTVTTTASPTATSTPVATQTTTPTPTVTTTVSPTATRTPTATPTRSSTPLSGW